MGDMKIVVAGCVAQQEAEQLLRRVPEVDLVMGESATHEEGWLSNCNVYCQLSSGQDWML